MSTQVLFSTRIHVKKMRLSAKELSALQRDLKDLRRHDQIGQRWSEEKYWGGYTSYASVADLHHRYPSVGELMERIDEEKKAYVRALQWEARPDDITLTSCWANFMGTGTHHSFHIHPLSVVSGAFFLQSPRGSSSFKIQDPRLPLFMGRPMVKAKAKDQPFVEVQPEVGTLILFESWLPHEVPAHQARHERVSLSFNYAWQT